MDTDKKHWNAYHKQWKNRWKVPANPRTVSAILSTLDVKNKKILEVGSGIGRDSIYLAKLGADCYLLDYIEAPLKIAREIAETEKVGITIIRGDANTLPFPDSCFDLVYSQGLIEHFTEPDVLIKEQRRVLKKGGYLLVDVPQKYHIYTLIKHILMFFNRWTPGWEKEYTVGQLKRLIKGCELEIVSTYGDWSHPNLFLKGLMIILKIPRKSPNIDLYQDSGSLMYRFKKTVLAHYTFQHIGVIGRKEG